MYKDLKTGDLLLFNSEYKGMKGAFDKIIKYGTHSSYNYTHIGMVLKDPTFISPTLKGLYLWQSGDSSNKDVEDHNFKFGVQINPLLDEIRDINTKVYLRKLIYKNEIFNDEKLKEIHDVVYDKPYDLVPADWLAALFDMDSDPQKIDRFWCSALVGYIYTQCKILKDDTDWSKMRPSDFSLDGENLSYTSKDDCFLENKQTLVKIRKNINFKKIFYMLLNRFRKFCNLVQLRKSQ